MDHHRPGVCKLLELALKRNMQESEETKQDGDSGKRSEDRNASRDAQSQVYTPEVSDGLKCELQRLLFRFPVGLRTLSGSHSCYILAKSFVTWPETLHNSKFKGSELI